MVVFVYKNIGSWWWSNVNGLTEKQKQFCDEYLIDFNATRAYKAVYKSCKKEETASANSSRLLRNDKIKAYIAERQQDRQERTEITQDMVLKELACIAFANGTDFAKIVEKTCEKPVFNDDGVQTGKEEVIYQDVEFKLTDELPEDKKRAIASIKQGKFGIEVKTADKIKALELLGKHIGLFNEKEQNNENSTNAIQELANAIKGVENANK